ncbi:helix-turn-helix transcriptional regulator [Actinoplanes sp. NPDC049265]|uniref:helix-turn-helix transcriptional regulator n=1 Tax=Actinoplanes sp. NPDC049265 TaxID=3363902 RepID=UPI00371F38F6
MSSVRQLRLFGMQELSTRLRVSRQRADKISRQKGFPEPLAELERGRVWDADDVDSWIAANRGPAPDEL